MLSSQSRRGNYDRLLDFSRAVTGTLFFVPSASFWRCCEEAPVPAAPSWMMRSADAAADTKTTASMARSESAH